MPFIVGDLLLVGYTPPSKAGSADGYNVVFDYDAAVAALRRQIAPLPPADLA